MNRLTSRILRKARRIVSKTDHVSEHGSLLPVGFEGQAASDLIRSRLLDDEPCMISRFGHTELKAVLRYWRQCRSGFVPNAWRYIQGKQGEFWWDDKIRHEVEFKSGIFPSTDEALIRFSERFLRDAGNIDILGTWLRDEAELKSLFDSAAIVRLDDLEPFHQKDPWTTALKNRTVLVVHPFESSIVQQYGKRSLLFADGRMLPPFTLKTLKAVQSLGGGASGFFNWFQALEWMCERIGALEFDIAIIGAGAYGLSLAAFVKNLGKKAIHLGGATQLMFGIRGARWDERPFYQALFNEHWIRPLPEDTPSSHQILGDSKSYW